MTDVPTYRLAAFQDIGLHHPPSKAALYCWDGKNINDLAEPELREALVSIMSNMVRITQDEAEAKPANNT